MNSGIDLRRRSVVLSTIGLPSIAAFGGLAGCRSGSSFDRQLSFSSLASAQEELSKLIEAKELRTLDKQEYELAHAMHLANHFSQFRAAS